MKSMKSTPGKGKNEKSINGMSQISLKLAPKQSDVIDFYRKMDQSNSQTPIKFNKIKFGKTFNITKFNYNQNINSS